jgi:hypothetical protein
MEVQCRTALFRELAACVRATGAADNCDLPAIAADYVRHVGAESATRIAAFEDTRSDARRVEQAHVHLVASPLASSSRPPSELVTSPGELVTSPERASQLCPPAVSFAAELQKSRLATLQK